MESLEEGELDKTMLIMLPGEKKFVEDSAIPELRDLFLMKKKLGEGANGVVFLAETKKNLKGVPQKTSVALKIINLTKISTKDFERKTKKEVAILKRLSSYGQCSPYVVCYYDDIIATWLGKKVYIIVTEYVDGIELANLIIDIKTLSKKKKYNVLSLLSIKELRKIFLQLLEGLSYMHSLNIVHRDIKSNNILVNKKTMNSKYIDLGFACLAIMKIRKSSRISSPEMPEKEEIADFLRCKIEFRGTPEFISPELARLYGQKSRDVESFNDIELLKKTDGWALGIALYELLYGAPPTSDLYDDVYNKYGASRFFDELSKYVVKDFRIYDEKLRPFVEVTAMLLFSNFKERSSVDKALNFLRKSKV